MCLVPLFLIPAVNALPLLFHFIVVSDVGPVKSVLFHLLSYISPLLFLIFLSILVHGDDPPCFLDIAIALYLWITSILGPVTFQAIFPPFWYRR